MAGFLSLFFFSSNWYFSEQGKHSYAIRHQCSSVLEVKHVHNNSNHIKTYFTTHTIYNDIQSPSNCNYIHNIWANHMIAQYSKFTFIKKKILCPAAWINSYRAGPPSPGNCRWFCIDLWVMGCVCCRRNCRGNPFCLNGLGEKSWFKELDESRWHDFDPESERREEVSSLHVNSE